MNLFIDTAKRPVEIPIHIDKLTDAKTTLNTVFKGRRVRQVMVLTKDDVEKPNSLADIETIVDRSTSSSGLEVKGPDGSSYIVPVDKKELDDTTISTRNLTVIAIVPSTDLKPYQFDGTSYEVSIYGKTTKKIKIINPEHKEIFNILFHGLMIKGLSMIAKYVSFGREKFAAIYAANHNPVTGVSQNSLIMSNLIHSSYYRTFTQQSIDPQSMLNDSLNLTLSPEIPKDGCSGVLFYFNQIVKNVSPYLKTEDYQDKHEMALKSHITKITESIIKGQYVQDFLSGSSHAAADTYSTDPSAVALDDEIIEDEPIKAVAVPTHLKALVDL